MLARPKQVSERSNPGSKAFRDVGRDIGPLQDQGVRAKPRHQGKQYVVVIGIDRYRSQPKLSNAVSDARGAQQAFCNLGFETQMTLFDEQATKQAMEQLVQDQLRSLTTADSLVLFFAGHGHTETNFLAAGRVQSGYLMPVDAGEKASSRLSLSSWLGELVRLPARHILVILDACYSGIALQANLLWAERAPPLPGPIEELGQIQSRRIITSARADQTAMDSGPIRGHSLFTGCLIEALTGGVGREFGFATSSNIGSYLQVRVGSYEGSSQTPDFGALEGDRRGEMVVRVPWARTVAPKSLETSQDIWNPDRARVALVEKFNRAEPVASGEAPRPFPTLGTNGAKGSLEHRPLAAHEFEAGFSRTLDRQAAERKLGAIVLSVVAGEPHVAARELATWSAQRGDLTLITQEARHELVISELLTYMPWSRCLPAARSRLSRATKVPVESIDGHLESRGADEKKRWFESSARGDTSVLVSGWLLTALRHVEDGALDLSSAPVHGRELLSVIGDLMTPIAILLCHEEPDEAWLREAIPTAAALTVRLPWHSVAVAAPQRLLDKVITSGQSGAMVMARQGMVKLRREMPDLHRRGDANGSSPLEAMKGLEQRLFQALAKDSRTKVAKFERRVLAPIYEQEREVEVALAARKARLIVELDSWYHQRDPQMYRRDRLKDMWLKYAGFFVMRFPVEDVERRLPAVIDEIAQGLNGRR